MLASMLYGSLWICLGDYKLLCMFVSNVPLTVKFCVLLNGVHMI